MMMREKQPGIGKYLGQFLETSAWSGFPLGSLYRRTAFVSDEIDSKLKLSLDNKVEIDERVQRSIVDAAAAEMMIERGDL
jgi:hypothetical protein